MEVDLEPTFDTLQSGVEGMSGFLGHFVNSLKLGGLGLRVSEGTNGVKIIAIG